MRILNKLFGRHPKKYKGGNNLPAAGWERSELHDAAWHLLETAKIFFEKKQLNDADELIKRAKVLFEQISDGDGIGACCLREGAICEEHNDLTGAETAYRSSMSLASSAKDYRRMSRCEESIGSILERKLDFEGALTAYKRAVELANLGGDLAWAGTCHGVIAALQRKQNNYSAAQFHFREGAKAATRGKDVEGQISCLLGLAGVYALAGDSVSALETLQTYIKMVSAAGKPCDSNALVLMEQLRQKVGYSTHR
jgi:tetratricopeptide (TPR) repeat protein